MKKLCLLVLIVLSIFITSCGNRTIDSLLNSYCQIFEDGVFKDLNEIVPSFWYAYAQYSKETFDEAIEGYIDKYGEEYKITYEIVDQYEYNDANYIDQMKNAYNIDVTDCYNIEVLIKYEGPKSTSEEQTHFRSCKYDGVRYLV